VISLDVAKPVRHLFGQLGWVVALSASNRGKRQVAFVSKLLLNSSSKQSSSRRHLGHGEKGYMSSPMTQQRKIGVYAGAALLRLVLFVAFPSLPDLLTGRVEISTPVTSFKRLQEGLFLYNHNVWPYDGGVYHQAPLLLPLFSLLPDVKTWPIFTSLFYIAVDLLSADALAKIADSGEAGQSKLFISPRRGKVSSGLIVAAA
jgi:hypothetical protein